jgi:hypothetical protein
MVLMQTFVLSEYILMKFFSTFIRAARSKAQVCGRAFAGIVGSNSTGAWMFVSCECLYCQVEVSATGRSPVQRSPTDCGVCLSVIK